MKMIVIIVLSLGLNCLVWAQGRSRSSSPQPISVQCQIYPDGSLTTFFYGQLLTYVNKETCQQSEPAFHCKITEFSVKKGKFFMSVVSPTSDEVKTYNLDTSAEVVKLVESLSCNLPLPAACKIETTYIKSSSETFSGQKSCSSSQGSGIGYGYTTYYGAHEVYELSVNSNKVDGLKFTSAYEVKDRIRGIGNDICEPIYKGDVNAFSNATAELQRLQDSGLCL